MLRISSWYVFCFFIVFFSVATAATNEVEDDLQSMKIKVVCRAIVIHNKALLLVSDDGKVWSAPGGGLKSPEYLPECIRREVHEETGLEVETGKLVYIMEFFDKGNSVHKVELFYLANALQTDIPRHWKDLGGNIQFARFVPFEEMNRINVQPQALKSLRNLDSNAKE